jgi:hypothetical protein
MLVLFQSWFLINVYIKPNGKKSNNIFHEELRWGQGMYTKLTPSMAYFKLHTTNLINVLNLITDIKKAPYEWGNLSFNM